ncbi:MAG: S-layer homology domain-containing protein [bacterium]
MRYPVIFNFKFQISNVKCWFASGGLFKYLIHSFVIFNLSFVISGIAFAEHVYLKDVAEGHWATEAVYELINRGITRGYPDGTFRGKRFISRYELSVFVAKFGESIKRQRAKDEKLIEEFKSEISLFKFQEQKKQEQTQWSGELQTRARASRLGGSGGRFDYRLQLALLKTFDPQSSLKIRVDTVDAGFNSQTNRDFSSRLIDFESKFKLHGYDFKVNLGPGVVVHTEADNFFPSENYTIYIRPKSAVEASKVDGLFSYSLAYVTRQVTSAGKIGVHELTGKAGIKTGEFSLHVRPRYLFELSGPRDALAEVEVNYEPNSRWQTGLLLGVGNGAAGQSGRYAKVSQKLKSGGTDLVLRFDKIGSLYRDDYLDEYEFVYLNNFNRLILDGTADFGVKVNHRLTEKLTITGQSDYVTTGSYQYGSAYDETYFIWQLGLDYQFSQTLLVQGFYRSYNVPSGQAQFGQAVPAVSDLFGLSLGCTLK